MINITDLAVTEYRKRRAERLDKKRLDDDWITIKGTHVLVDDNGDISKGPDALKSVKKSGKTPSKNVISPEMSPESSGYDYEEGDTRSEWIHKNVDRLQSLYDEGGGKAIDSEFRKFLMDRATKDIHPITKDEADEAIYDNEWITQSLYDGWFRNADSSYKPKLVNAIIKDEKTRNAALNLAYENYKHNTDSPVPFEEFLTTPIKLYRGEHGQKHTKDDVFDAYTFDKKMAEHFAGSGDDSRVFEIEVRPIDTYGSMRAVGEAEIWVPREISHPEHRDAVDEERFDAWEWSDPVRWAFEDFKEAVKQLDESRETEILDAIVLDAETLRLFDGNKSEVGCQVRERCIESIQKSILQLTALVKSFNGDSAFFAGELDENIGEFENPPMAHVEAFRERRQKRLDAKEPAAWITVNGNHIPVDEDGNPVGGQEKALGIGSTKKREFSEKISEILKSGKSSEEQDKEALEVVRKLPVGSKIQMPDTWDSDDGYKNYAVLKDDGRWEMRYGRGKNDKYTISDEELAGYLVHPEEKERATISRVAGESKTATKPNGVPKFKHDGSVVGNHMKDFHNENVSQEDRDFIKDAIPKHIQAGQWKYDPEDRRAYFSAGQTIRDEVKRRHDLRVKDPTDATTRDEEPQPEDIFETLRDVRPFGPPEGYDKVGVYVDDDADRERFNSIVEEAMSMYPTDWYEDEERSSHHKSLSIVFHDMPGRAKFSAGYFGAPSVIHLYTQQSEDLMKWLPGEDPKKCDRQLANELVHELGHYMEHAVPKVRRLAERCLRDRTADSEEEDLEPGYKTKPDKFFDTYIGKQYPWGDTEVTSTMMQHLCGGNPFSILQGKNYFSDKKDPESLKYILGILGGL